MPRLEKDCTIDMIDYSIGWKIKTLRTERGMSRMQLAPIIGVTHQQLTKYENGTNRIRSGRLKILADHFGVGINSFYDNEDGVELNRGRMTLDLMRNFNKNEPEMQEAICLLAKIGAKKHV
jgi:transcriptional regulator with XRE-family HTH domain